MTPEREKKFRRVIENRQTDLTIVLENVDDPHNISACLRTCDAVGVSEVHIIRTNTDNKSFLGKRSSASARKWISARYFDTVEECFEVLRKKYERIYTTGLSIESQNLYDLNLAASVALVFGNEHEGVSEMACSLADGNFTIPQMGMIPSLNISVACAVSLYEALRQRKEAELYPNPNSNREFLSDLHDAWVERETISRRR